MFAHWDDLVFFLRLPAEAYSGNHTIPAWDKMDTPVLEAEDRRSPAVRFCRDSGRARVLQESN